MADEKQLTVAELLARNAKDRSGGEKSSRRRRRSLDEGGISVAELTGNLEKVKATPTESKHSNVSIDETAPVIPAPAKDADKAETAETAEKSELQKAESTKAKDKQQSAAVRLEKPETSVKENKAESAEKADKPDKSDKPSDEDTRVIQRVKDEPAKKAETTVAEKAPEDETTTTGELEAIDQDHDDYYDEYDEDYEEEKLNPFAVVLLALVGIVLGAVVFKGFEILWDRFDRLVVVVLGIVVTGVIVGIVHALRTNRDGLSMFLAAVAGLVLTFGLSLIHI